MSTHPQAATFDVQQLVDDLDKVRVRLDRPGVAAISYVGDPEDLIRRIAEAAGLDVEIVDAEEPEVGQGVNEVVFQPSIGLLVGLVGQTVGFIIFLWFAVEWLARRSYDEAPPEDYRV